MAHHEHVLTEREILDRIADLEAALREARTPAPQPYPRWIEIAGVSRVVESADEEQRLTAATSKAARKKG